MYEYTVSFSVVHPLVAMMLGEKGRCEEIGVWSYGYVGYVYFVQICLSPQQFLGCFEIKISRPWTWMPGDESSWEERPRGGIPRQRIWGVVMRMFEVFLFFFSIFVQILCQIYTGLSFSNFHFWLVAGANIECKNTQDCVMESKIDLGIVVNRRSLENRRNPTIL